VNIALKIRSEREEKKLGELRPLDDDERQLLRAAVRNACTNHGDTGAGRMFKMNLMMTVQGTLKIVIKKMRRKSQTGRNATKDGKRKMGAGTRYLDDEPL